MAFANLQYVDQLLSMTQALFTLVGLKATQGSKSCKWCLHVHPLRGMFLIECCVAKPVAVYEGVKIVCTQRKVLAIRCGSFRWRRLPWSKRSIVDHTICDTGKKTLFDWAQTWKLPSGWFDSCVSFSFKFIYI